MPAAIVMRVPHNGLGGGAVGNIIDMGGPYDGGGPLGGGIGLATDTTVGIGCGAETGVGGGTDI